MAISISRSNWALPSTLVVVIAPSIARTCSPVGAAISARAGRVENAKRVAAAKTERRDIEGRDSMDDSTGKTCFPRKIPNEGREAIPIKDAYPSEGMEIGILSRVSTKHDCHTD
ncbi:MAG: hypothetical protein EAZ66_06965 [Alphaproteobacteria bacterium]|nr:MAG: hypothetical protein EAZ66_06965 [Alphaproteobacteria bacterium]